MQRIESKVKKGELLHFIVRRGDFVPGRVDLIGPDNFLQCSMLSMEKGKTFRPHKHIWHDTDDYARAQESWVVIKGIVKAIYYDINDKIILETLLYEGDASFTLDGGHNYEIMENDTRVLEYKTGPYFGQEKDKTFI